MDMDQMIRSLNGYDELAIEKHFDADILDLLDKPVKAGRALLMIQARRDGMTDKEAHDHVMGLTVGFVNDAFEDAPDEIFPDQPETPEGKGGSELESEPVTSLPSVLPPGSNPASTQP